MQGILGKAVKVYVVDENLKGVLPLLNLDKGAKPHAQPAAPKEVKQ
jgi:hypothetical protein